MMTCSVGDGVVYLVRREVDMLDTLRLFQRSGRLFAVPSFLTGFARVLDIGATFTEYNTDDDPQETDRKAMMSDWHAVGDDLADAIHSFRR